MHPFPWTTEQTDYLTERYGITSLVEFARYFDKPEQEVKEKIAELGLKSRWLSNAATPEITRQLAIRQLMLDNKRYLPNGWLVGLAMSRAMLRSLSEQIEQTLTWLEEIEEEISDVLDRIVETYEITPLLSVGDMLLGKDLDQTYRVTGREFMPALKQITYYFTYLYGGGDIPEEYDDDDLTEGFTLHDN